jgi:hypothetical protein
LAGHHCTRVYRPGNPNGKPGALSSQLEYCPENGDSSKNSLQLILLILNLGFFISEMTLEDIRIWTLISGSKLHSVPPIKFNADLIEGVVMAAMNDQEWQESYNAAKDINPSPNVEDLHGAHYYQGRSWIPTKDDLGKMISEVDHDSKMAGHMDQDKTIKIIKYNIFWAGRDKYIEDLGRFYESW